MPPPNGLKGIYISHLSVSPSVCLSVCDVFSVAITNEPLDGSSWNCRNIFFTLKWRAELYFQGRAIQDGRLCTTFIRNLYGSITLYWIEILTSIFFYFVPEVTPKQKKVPKIAENYRKLSKMARNPLHQSITLYWIEIFIRFFSFFFLKWSPNRRRYLKLPKITKFTENCWKQPKTTYYFVLDWDIDFNFFYW